MSKEKIATIYKVIGRSIQNYAAPVWTSSLCDTKWKDLQTKHNNAFRIATGCVKMILPVRPHNKFLSKQYLTAYHLPGHPNLGIIIDRPPNRNIRQDIRRDKKSLRKTCNTLHQKVVIELKSGYIPNRLLGEHPQTPPTVKSFRFETPEQSSHN